MTTEGDIAASAALDRVKTAWADWIELIHERKTRRSEITLKIDELECKIDELLFEKKTKPMSKIREVESLWRRLAKTKEQRSNLMKLYREKIGKAHDSIGATIKDIRQGDLPFDENDVSDIIDMDVSEQNFDL